MRNMILASVCAAAMLASGAASAQVTGTLAGGYARITDGGGVDLYGANGTIATTIGNGWSFEGAGSYYNANPGASDLWTAGGNFFVGTGFGRIAAGAFTGSPLGVGHATTYGAGADWFYSDDITLSVKGGGQYLSGGSDGGYVGLQGIYYLMPNLGLSAAFDFVGNSAGDINSQKIKAEWKFDDSLPISVYGGYQRFETGGTDANAIFVGLKFYLDGASTLVGSQRTGSLGYIGQSVFQIGAY